MDDPYNSRSASAVFEPSPFCQCTSTFNKTKKPTVKRQPIENKYTQPPESRTSIRHPSTPKQPRSKMPKCAYCGNQSDHYSCNCGSEYSSTSSVDKNPTSLNDPKPELGISSSVSGTGTGSGSSTYTSTQSHDYVGKPSGSSSGYDPELSVMRREPPTALKVNKSAFNQSNVELDGSDWSLNATSKSN
ncbi:uncharacterized protein Z520_08600 [Fonsecaea multimorphosa CBS 102226]|uniref:Uncharacterized protein n=1 Tax=Fonsecaea multimorphosa CBS 102226 TaxID=1442371 RepID=A0A0D2JR98_9EURO|nr:uncharacterized protein Z520_08600 [Fonsecaea multimorphosa CBS 102226]KIX95892.1 hypothetical protein Z520_08600 [Fonsecaea multimorphosa CBS 102226]OAL21623.1 hypothetical protein AYO22_08019 [Fonsecaea multimorphosa]